MRRFVFIIVVLGIWVVLGCAKKEVNIEPLEEYMDVLRRLKNGFVVGITKPEFRIMLIDVMSKKDKLVGSGLLEKEGLEKFKNQIEKIEDFCFMLKEIWERESGMMDKNKDKKLIELLKKHALLEAYTVKLDNGRRVLAMWKFNYFMGLVVDEIVALENLYPMAEAICLGKRKGVIKG